MRKYICIGFGGFFGAVVRFLISNVIILKSAGNFPLNTFIINITGSFLIALVLTSALELRIKSQAIKAGITTGFLGSYTTFSTFCKETVALMLEGRYYIAGLYMVLSGVAGFSAVYLGAAWGRSIKKRYTENVRKDAIEWNKSVRGLDSEVH